MHMPPSQSLYAICNNTCSLVSIFYVYHLILSYSSIWIYIYLEQNIWFLTFLSLHQFLIPFVLNNFHPRSCICGVCFFCGVWEFFMPMSVIFAAFELCNIYLIEKKNKNNNNNNKITTLELHWKKLKGTLMQI